jgi:hypothetical protein
MTNYASSMITDMVNPDNKMFHNEGEPPIYCKMTTSTNPSEIVQYSLARILEYLTEFIKPDNFEWYRTDSILTKKSGELRLDLNTLIVHLAYENEPDRALSFQLSLSAAELVLN